MSFQVQILGANSASFAHNRHHTSQVVRINNQHFLLDCGEATQLLLKRHKVKLSKIDHILISHLHGDHYYGLMGLISTIHLYGRQKPLVLIGPPGLSDIITLQLKYSQTVLNYKIDFIEWEDGFDQIIYENEKIFIQCIPLDHRIPCSGYLLKEKPKQPRINKDVVRENLSPATVNQLRSGQDVLDVDGKIKYSHKEAVLPPLPSRSYAYCSDTRFNSSIVSYITHADLLYHEATFQDDQKERASATYHSTARQAAMIAQSAKVKRLIIGHFSTRYMALDKMLEEAQEVFNETELAMEGNTYEIQ